MTAGVVESADFEMGDQSFRLRQWWKVEVKCHRVSLVGGHRNVSVGLGHEKQTD